MNRSAFIAACAVTLPVSAAFAQSEAACQHVMTSYRDQSCWVEVHAICQNGDRVTEAYRDGNYYGTRVTDTDQDLISNTLGLPDYYSQVVAVQHHFSLDELIERGRSSGSYTMGPSNGDLGLGLQTWEAELLPNTVEMNGVLFQLARFHTRDGVPVQRGRPVEDWALTLSSTVLVDIERRLMIRGPVTFEDDVTLLDYSIFLPGDPGFDVTLPEGCPHSPVLIE